MLNKQQAIQRVQQTFLHPYNDDNYSIFITDLLKNLKTNDNFEKQIENDDHIESFKRIGCYEDNNGDIIDILSVKVKHGAILERTRTRLRDFTVDHIRNSPTDPDGCLVAFYADEFNDWRFSFVKMSYKVVEDVKTGKIKTKEEISEPKRFSFLIGRDEPSFTAQKQMIPLLQSSNIAFNDIVDAFSTERVTNEFYQAYRALFEDLTLSLFQIKENDPKIKENFEKEFIKEDDFAKKLLGQIVFIYFIQRKGWLGIKKDNNGNFGNWGSGDKKFIRNLFNKKYCQYNNFFNDVLEHLFYNGLGTENSDNYFSLLDCKVPFLNGGIFEPLNNYNWQETDIIIEDKNIEEILDVFDRFNFTVREESELDVDVAVDPEMLGRVFENLLPENIRRGKAAYYTPRTIVSYMCQESIINYLNSETEEYIDLDTIQDFIKRNNVEELSKNNAELLDSLLKNIKICDPAIGSGAFPLGILNQIVISRSLLCSRTGKKIDKYNLKRYAIINSIYGVDLDPGAVEIAKLRLFLSLIVEEKDYDSIEPLPNLDFQIMQGDSLIEEFYGVMLDINKKTVQGNLFEDINKIDDLISNLHQAQTLFSNESNYKRKRELKSKVENCIIDIFKFKYSEKKNISDIHAEQMDKDIDKIVHEKKPRNFFPWKLYFADIFRSKGGFDIIIGNPPYISSKKIKNKDQYIKFNTAKGQYDLYSLFIEKGINLLKNNGIFNLIIPDSFLARSNFKHIRNYFFHNGKLLNIIQLDNVFKSADVSSCIFFQQKTLSNKEYEFNYIKSENSESFKNKIYNECVIQKNYIKDSDGHKILFLNTKERLLISKIFKGTKFKSFIKAWRGEELGKKSDKIIQKIDINNHENIIFGENVERYSLKKSKYLIFEGDVRKNLNDYKSEKIVIRQVGSKINASLDKDGLISAQSVYNLYSVSSDINNHILLGLLNSSLYNFIYQKLFAEKMKFPRIILENIRELPVPELNNNYNLLIDLNLLVKNIMKIEKVRINDYNNIVNEIDDIIFRMFDLNEEEISIVNSFE